MDRVRITLAADPVCSDDFRGAIAPLALEQMPVHLDQLGVVDRRPESFFNRLKIDLMAIAGELDTVSEAPGQVTPAFRASPGPRPQPLSGTGTSKPFSVTETKQ